MKRIPWFMLVFVMVVLLVGCGKEDGDDSPDDQYDTIEFDVIASEKSLPDNFHETSFAREESPLFQYLIKKADNQADYEDIWNLYGLENDIPNVDFDRHSIIFVGVQESGSCPTEIKDLAISAENSTLAIFLLDPDGDCNADATPRSFVVKVEKAVIEEVDKVRMIESREETNIPLEN